MSDTQLLHLVFGGELEEVTGTTFRDGMVNLPRVCSAVGVSVVCPTQLPSFWGTRFGRGRVGSAMRAP